MNFVKFSSRFNRAASLALALAVIITALVPVTAYAAESNFIDLLEYGTVNDSDSNMFNFTTTTTVRVDVPMYTLLRYIDIVFVASDNTAPTSVRVRYNQTYINLTVKQVTSGIYRAYGTLNEYYDEIYIQFNASGTQTYIMQSCKVSSVITSTSKATTRVDFTAYDGTYTSTSQPASFSIPAGDTGTGPFNYTYQAVINVTDATDYDTLYIYGSTNYASLESIRCTYGPTIVPYTVNYFDVEATGTQWVDQGSYEVNRFGKYIYAIEVDLSGIERNLNQYCIIYINGKYISNIGVDFNMQSCAGSVTFADTEKVTWWNKFTSFMSDLFGGDSSEADDFKDDMEQQGQDVQDAADQIDQVTRPPVEDVEVSIDQYVNPEGVQLIGTGFTDLLANNLVLSMVMISFIVGLVGFIIF